MSAPVSNATEYTVSEIAAALKRTIEDNFGYVRVRGEISGYRGPHSSGHAYFSLKDDRAVLEAVVWRTTFQKLRFKPEAGLEVIATGRLTTFPGSSKYQIVIESLEPAGAGALMALLEERRKRLAGEGLFARQRKKPLPYLPRVIGVITSPTGAVIRDILHRLADRFPVEVLLWPVRVQGETAAAEVAAAIEGFNALTAGGALPRPDVLIVARGGGSLEDLWAFNEEIVVRAAAASAIPLVSAVGHETDVTLIDHAADLRAPTPTGAAEMVVPVRSELVAAVDAFARRHGGAVLRLLEARRRDLRGLVRNLPTADDVLERPRRRLDELGARLGRSLSANNLAHRGALGRVAPRLSPTLLGTLVERSRIRVATLGSRQAKALDVHAERKAAAFGRTGARLRIGPIAESLGRQRERLGQLAERSGRSFGQELERLGGALASLGKLLGSLSYRNVLARGFALVQGPDGAMLSSAAEVKPATALQIEFHDGHIGALATGREAPRPRRRRQRGPIEGQGTLF